MLDLLSEPRWRLVTLAGVTLFLELALIRWMSTNVFHLGFFANFVLLGCFLGIGLGFLSVRRFSTELLRFAPLALFGVLAFVTLARVELPIAQQGSVIFVGTEAVPPLIPIPLFLLVLFVGVVGTFACITNATGRCFQEMEPLRAYNYDIIGSLLGILAFTALSALRAPSVVWFSIVAAVLIALMVRHVTPRQLRVSGLALFACIALSTNPDVMIHADRVVWSPYTMITAFDDEALDDTIHVFTNRIPYQTIMPQSEREAFRDVPYAVAKEHGLAPFKRALIVGAGSGMDVGTALEHDVAAIDAVELDPVIADLARDRNPDRVYQSERVRLIVDDGRHVVEQAERHSYDLIVYALPDSVSLLSSQSNVRLESFLFTREAIEGVRDALADGGMFTMYNYYRNPAIVHRLAALVTEVFGHPPDVRILNSEYFAVISIGKTVRGEPLNADPATIKDLPTDDWPFLYMMRRHLPLLYIVPLLVLLLLSGGAVWWLMRGTERSSFQTSSVPLFFMGGAFLLLETKSIVQFSLLFGATWVVNSLVFAAVLVMVLLANSLVARGRIGRIEFWYVGLAIALFAGWYVELGLLNTIESAGLRYIAASALMLSPIFMANVIFAGTFATSEASEVSFGWNLIGTMVGGWLEYSSLALGYRNLTIFVALLYLAAFVSARLSSREMQKD